MLALLFPTGLLTQDGVCALDQSPSHFGANRQVRFLAPEVIKHLQFILIETDRKRPSFCVAVAHAVR